VTTPTLLFVAQPLLAVRKEFNQPSIAVAVGFEFVAAACSPWVRASEPRVGGRFRCSFNANLSQSHVLWMGKFFEMISAM